MMNSIATTQVTATPAPSATAIAPPQVAAAVIGDEWTDRRASEQALRAATARQVSGRRRFVDPTTCDREYSLEEMEFMQAMQDYKKSSGRMFPTWSEILEVLRNLGYEKPPGFPSGSEYYPAAATEVA